MGCPGTLGSVPLFPGVCIGKYKLTSFVERATLVYQSVHTGPQNSLTSTRILYKDPLQHNYVDESHLS